VLLLHVMWSARGCSAWRRGSSVTDMSATKRGAVPRAVAPARAYGGRGDRRARRRRHRQSPPSSSACSVRRSPAGWSRWARRAAWCGLRASLADRARRRRPTRMPLGRQAGTASPTARLRRPAGSTPSAMRSSTSMTLLDTSRQTNRAKPRSADVPDTLRGGRQSTKGAPTSRQLGFHSSSTRGVMWVQRPSYATSARVGRPMLLLQRMPSVRASRRWAIGCARPGRVLAR
jgi:hypothetical protein